MGISALFEEQILALNHIQKSFLNNVNPICALGMGMGKTRVAIEVIKKYIEQARNENYMILIVIKTSNYSDPWEPELNKNINLQNIIFLHGTDRNKYLIKGKYIFSGNKIILTSYETLRLDIEAGKYKKTKCFDLIIYDELHNIINSKRLTKRIIELSLLNAKYKLALTGTPLENYIEEIGLINIFLNDIESFKKLIIIFKKSINGNKVYNKEIIKAIFDKGHYNAIKDNVIFHYIKSKEGIRRYERILSVPIDERMKEIAESKFKKYSAKQRKYLSYPASVQKKEDKMLLPRCTKADAVKIILKSMLENEKVIVYSLYIDVIIAYSEFCRELGFNSIIITGKDKGGKLEEKLKEFRYTNSIKILFTTLQKSAEGLNLVIATHVIILEFWWNPQKLFQAMGRVDRLTQGRNIFLYILCYNYKGDLIDIEKKYYNKLSEKVKITRDFYSLIDEKQKNDINILPSKNYELPPIEKFKNINTFEYELKEFIASFEHTHRENKKIFDNFGTSINEVRMKMIQDTAEDLEYIDFLSKHPWSIELQYMRDYIYNYCLQKLNGTNAYKLWPNVNDFYFINNYKPKYEQNYSIIYIKNNIYDTIINNSKIKIQVHYILGKKKTGNYDILLIYLSNKNNILSLLKKIKNNGVKNISIIVYSKSETNNNFNENDLNKIYPMAKTMACITELFLNLKRFHMSNEDINNVNQILRKETLLSAQKLCQNFSYFKEGKPYIFRQLNRDLMHIPTFFSYKPDTRSIISSTNIIRFINYNTQILLDMLINLNIYFINKSDFHKFITIVAYKVLAEGNSFLPTWEKLIKPIRIH